MRASVCVSACAFFFSSLLFLHFVMFIPSIAYCFILPNFWEMRIISICTDMCMRIEAPLLFSVPNIRNGYNNTIVQCISIYCIYSYPFSILVFFFYKSATLHVHIYIAIYIVSCSYWCAWLPPAEWQQLMRSMCLTQQRSMVH